MRPKTLYKELEIKLKPDGTKDTTHHWITFGRLDYPVKSVTMQVTPSNPWNSGYTDLQGSLDGEHWFDLSGGNFFFNPNQNGGAFTISTKDINRTVPFIRVSSYVVTTPGAGLWTHGKIHVQVNFA